MIELLDMTSVSRKLTLRLLRLRCRVYKTFDPRAKVMQNICHQLFEQLDIECAPLFTSRACHGDKIAASVCTLVPREKEGSGLQRPAHELIRPPNSSFLQGGPAAGDRSGAGEDRDER